MPLKITYHTSLARTVVLLWRNLSYFSAKDVCIWSSDHTWSKRDCVEEYVGHVIDMLAMSSWRPRSQFWTGVWAVYALARDEVHHSVWFLLDVLHLARLSRLCRGRPRPCSCCLPAPGSVSIYVKKSKSLIDTHKSRYVFTKSSGVAGTSLSVETGGQWFDSPTAPFFCMYANFIFFVGTIFFVAIVKYVYVVRWRLRCRLSNRGVSYINILGTYFDLAYFGGHRQHMLPSLSPSQPVIPDGVFFSRVDP